MLAVIPQPAKVQINEGYFPFAALSGVSATPQAAPVAEYIAGLLGPSGDIAILGDTAARGALRLSLLRGDGEMAREEAYRLNVASDHMALSASTLPGLMRGAQTVAQLLHTAENGRIACAEIDDYPRFTWRGSLLDACRHFWSVADTRRYIDLLALYKMNVLHWHLTEDQGWRIEIARYPKLTEVGAWRDDGAGGKYGGFYTQDEIREVVAYATARGITVVPEIEMPGHAVAALAAYPELSCTGGPFAVRTKWGVEEDVYCAGNEKVFSFLEDVLTEVMELFPSRIIHVGGDECPKKRWEQCPKCQARMKEEGLKTEFELQKYFINRMARFLDSHGRVLAGWDEILESSAGGVGHQVEMDFTEQTGSRALAKSAVVQSWRGITGGVAAARSGHDVIMSPTTHCYLDYGVESHPTRNAYAYEPIPEELSDSEARYVLGLEGNVWTERIADRNRWDYQVFPRVCALAEVGWSAKQQRNWEQFRGRLRSHERLFARRGVEFWRDPEVWD